MASNPTMPAPTVSSATTSSAITLVTGPRSSPSSVKTVEVASTASDVSAVSQPTSSTQEMTAASRLPCTPNAARLSSIVGAEPRRPARATTPQSAKEMTTPMTPTRVACRNEMPKPRMNEP